MFVVFSGRQTDLTVAEGSAQERIRIWSEGLTLFRQAPLFGIGQGNYVERVGYVAHNSFLHCYTELGFFGGTLFLGAFFCALWTLHRLGSQKEPILDPELRRLRPYLMALTAGYAAGMLSLSRAYVVPTYLILGLVEVYILIATSEPVLSIQRFNAQLVARLSVVGLAFLASTYAFIRLFVRWE
jgi:hypothetical protein